MSPAARPWYAAGLKHTTLVRPGSGGGSGGGSSGGGASGDGGDNGSCGRKLLNKFSPCADTLVELCDIYRISPNTCKRVRCGATK